MVAFQQQLAILGEVGSDNPVDHSFEMGTGDAGKWEVSAVHNIIKVFIYAECGSQHHFFETRNLTSAERQIDWHSACQPFYPWTMVTSRKEIHQNGRTVSEEAGLERGRHWGGYTVLHTAGVPAPFVDADSDRVFVGFSTFAAGPAHGECCCDVFRGRRGAGLISR